MERYIWQDSPIILATTPKLIQGVFIVHISDSNCYSFNSLMDKGKRPVTASQEEAEGRAKKPTFRTSNAPLSQEQLSNYEPQNVTTTVGDSAKEPNEMDEIQKYAKRYVGPTEQSWHMYPPYKRAIMRGEQLQNYEPQNVRTVVGDSGVELSSEIPEGTPIYGAWSDYFNWFPMRMGRPLFKDGEWTFVEAPKFPDAYMDEGTFNRLKARRDGIIIDPTGAKTMYQAKEPNETDEIREYLPKRYVGPTTLACNMYPAYKQADIQGESAAKYWFRIAQKPIKINFP